jgi:hypothetical protein
MAVNAVDSRLLPLPLPRLWMQLIGWDMQLHPQPWIGKPKPINKPTNQPTNQSKPNVHAEAKNLFNLVCLSNE